MTFCNKYSTVALIIGPWFNFIVILREFLTVLLFKWSKSTMNPHTLMSIEIVAYVLCSILWRCYIMDKIHHKRYKMVIALYGFAVGLTTNHFIFLLFKTTSSESWYWACALALAICLTFIGYCFYKWSVVMTIYHSAAIASSLTFGITIL